MIRYKTIVVVALVSMLFMTSAGLFAQEEAEDVKRENVEYFMVVLTDFQAGKVGRAEEIIADHFQKAGEAAGNPVATVYHAQTGPWDMVTFFPMGEGFKQLSHSRTAEGRRWREEMIKQLGSEEAFTELMDEFNSLIVADTSFLVHKHLRNTE